MHVQLTVVHGQEVVTEERLTPGDRWIVGRSPSAQVTLPNPDVSRRHTLFALELDGLSVTDLDSHNGTTLRGERLSPHVPFRVEDGDHVGVGSYRIRVSINQGVKTRGLTRKWRDEDVLAAPPGFELESLLGEGAYGRVWAAKRLEDSKLFAVKILTARAEAEEHRRFEREGKLLADLDSPYLVKTYAYGAMNGRAYIVMELIQGVSGAKAVLQGALAPKRVVQLGEDLAGALEAAHRFGVIHRDVKPGNTLIPPQGHAKLTDFGIAKFGSLDRLTQTGVGLGSLPYVPPEQAVEAKAADERADLYGLGATLFHFVTGSTPFGKGTSGARPSNLLKLIDRIQNETPPLATELNPDCPAPLANLIAQLLAKDPEERPNSATAVRDALREIRAKCFPPTEDSGAATERNLPAVSRFPTE